MKNLRISNKLNFSRFLMDEYPYERLQLKDDSKRKSFAYAMAQCWEFTRSKSQASRDFSFLNCFALPFSIIINSEYQLIIDEVEIIETITHQKACDLINPRPSKTPIDYGQRFSKWKFLEELKDSPTYILKTLILVANAMSTQTHLLEYSRISGDTSAAKGIDYLSTHGLILLDPPKINLLAIFPVERLKRFVAENGIDKIPSRKDDIINLIKEKCDPEATLALVNFLLNDPQYGYGYAKEKFMLPTIPNAKLFQEYVKSELNRLSLYLEYIGCIEFKHPTVIIPVSKQNQPGKRPGDSLQNANNDDRRTFYSPNDSIKRIRNSDLQVIKKYWDENCDALLLKVKKEIRNSLPVGELVSEVMEYWDRSGVLSQFKKETRNPEFETHWHWLLNTYAEYLLASTEKYQLKRRKLTCKGCSKNFQEWSIPIYYAITINYKIEFCYSCYSYIFNHHFMANTTEAAMMPENEMLDYLYQLSKALKPITKFLYINIISRHF